MNAALMTLRSNLRPEGDLAGMEAISGEGWTRFRLPEPGPGVSSASGFMEVAAAGPLLPAGVRITVGDDGRKCWEVETAEVEEGDGGSDLSWALGALGGVVSRGEEEHRGARPEGLPGNVAQVLREDGRWILHERGNGLVVDLKARNGMVQAQLSGDGQEILSTVEVLRSGEGGWPGVVDEALAVFLVTVASHLRLVRACAGSLGGEEVRWFEVSLPRSRFAAEALGEALGALALAWGETVEEAMILQFPETAARYLAVRGWGGDPGEENNQQN